MFNRFRRKAPPQSCSLYIDGYLYTRHNTDIMVLLPDGKLLTCGSDHVAPNGASILQIAYALAFAENLINAIPVRSVSPAANAGLN